MKIRVAVLIPAVCLAIAAMSAMADPLTFNTNPSGTIVGPYSLTLGSSTPLSVFCMNDTNEVYAGESWGVTVMNGTFFAGSAPGTTGFLYEEEAYIYHQYNGTNATDVQYALWTILDPTTPHQDAGSNALVSAAGSFNYANAAFLADTTFYFYDASDVITPGETGPPQNFVGTSPMPMPEPSSLLLLGSGLVGFVGLLRRRFIHS